MQKRTTLLTLVLALLLVGMLGTSALGTSALAATADESQSEAKVAFTAGDLEIIDVPEDGVSFTNMNIDFGSHPVPVREASYKAVDKTHRLQVADARETAGGWHLKVGMGSFINTADAGNQFVGSICFQNRTLDTGTNPLSALTVPTSFEVVSNAGSAVEFARAESGLAHSMFAIMWQKDDIIMTIPESQVKFIQVNASYEATMTWTMEMN